jgi:hypothetical protein
VEAWDMGEAGGFHMPFYFLVTFLFY